MIAEDALRALIIQKIRKDEDLGEKSGGSGHLSHTDYKIRFIDKAEKSTNGWKLTYSYLLSISTEFTYYPDNPPQEYVHTVLLELDEEFNILKELVSCQLSKVG